MNRFLHLGLGWIGDKAGGLERYQHGVCTCHSSMGLDVSAWVQSRCVVDTSTCNYNVQSYASPEDTRANKIRRLKQLASEEFKRGDFTFVSHHASVSATLRRELTDRPHIVHFQGPWAKEAAIEGAPWWKTTLQYALERRIYNAADRIITLSEAFRELVVKSYRVNIERVHAVPGGIDAQAGFPGVSRAEARNEMGLPTDRPVLVSVRRLVRRVGLDVLLQALSILKQRKLLRDLLVCIAGSGPQRAELEAYVRDNGLNDHVRFLGFVPDQMLSRAYRAADLSVVPTQHLEGFGLVTIESMAAGTPCLVTPIGSLPEIATPISPQLISADASSRAIAETIAAYLQGAVHVPSEAECINYVKLNYDWSVIGPRVLKVYQLDGN